MTTPKPRPLLRILLIFSLIAINIGCDRVSKSVVRENIAYHEHIQVISDSNLIDRIAFGSVTDFLHIDL